MHTSRRFTRIAIIAIPTMLAAALLASTGAWAVSTPRDLCANLAGIQSMIPAGLTAAGSACHGDALDNAVAGTSGIDFLDSGAGNDTLDGLAGNDHLIGGSGNDTVIGGSGRDTLRGYSGDDLVDARDGATGDTVNCGGGFDTARIDAGDTVLNCERVITTIRTVPGRHLVQFVRVGPSVPVQPSDAAYVQALQRVDGAGWAAADGTISIRLPDGRDLWLYGDTMLNLPRTNGTLRRNADFVRNSAVLQDGNRMTTLLSGTASNPDDFLKPPGEPNRWYWPGHGIAEGNELVLFMGRVRSTDGGMPGWNFAADGSDMVRLNLRDLSVKSVVRLPGSAHMAWGATVVSDATHTYIYGMETGTGIYDRYAHVARAPKDSVGYGSWEYWDGTAWNTNPATSQPILQGVSNQYTVLPTPNGSWALISQSIFLQPHLYISTAPTPRGPWTQLRELTTGPVLAPNEISYNAMAHPQFTHDNKLLISWNINKADGTLPSVHELHHYRARFDTIPLTALNTPTP
jgi:hypothetical protein